MYDGDTSPTDNPLQRDQPEDHPTQPANVAAPVNRLVLPLLRARSVRLVQVCRAAKSDTDGVLVLDDSRTS